MIVKRGKGLWGEYFLDLCDRLSIVGPFVGILMDVDVIEDSLPEFVARVFTMRPYEEM